MLIAIRDYILKRGVCSLEEISGHFATSPDAMRGMLAHWVRKGKVAKEFSGCNKGCVSCAPEMLEFYSWQNQEVAELNSIPLCNLS